MKIIAGIKFNVLDKIYNFDQNNIILNNKDKVIVETEQGMEIGTVIFCNKEVDEAKLEFALKPILRKATTTDLDKQKNYQAKQEEALKICKELVKKHQLDMKIVAANFTFDGSKLVFYFTAESRVDFRELVKDLTKKFQKSIRLQQVGSRDVAAKCGGCGLCGKELCCNRFLRDFASITTDMAREQQMVQRGSERISGVCGRLLCCLSYEKELYQELSKDFPVIGAKVKTQQGIGTVIGRNLLTRNLEILLEDKTRISVKLPEK